MPVRASSSNTSRRGEWAPPPIEVLVSVVIRLGVGRPSPAFLRPPLWLGCLLRSLRLGSPPLATLSWGPAALSSRRSQPPIASRIGGLELRSDTACFSAFL